MQDNQEHAAMLAVTMDETRVMFAALEQAAYLAKGRGDDARAELLWGIFNRMQRLQFAAQHDVRTCPDCARPEVTQ